MPKRVRLSSPRTVNQTWMNELHSRVGEGPFLIQGYAVAALPSASAYGYSGSSDPYSSLIFVYDESGGAVLAFSDGTDWRRVTDRAIVS